MRFVEVGGVGGNLLIQLTLIISMINGRIEAVAKKE